MRVYYIDFMLALNLKTLIALEYTYKRIMKETQDPDNSILGNIVNRTFPREIPFPSTSQKISCITLLVYPSFKNTSKNDKSVIKYLFTVL